MKSLVRLIVLCALCLAGCRNGSGSSGASAAVQSSNPLSRLPAPVVAAFQKNHPHVAAKLVHVRLYPDGTTHYQIIFVDKDGQSQQASYYADGRSVP